MGKRPFAGQTNYQAHMAGTDRSETLSERKQEHPGIPLSADLPELNLPGVDADRPGSGTNPGSGGSIATPV